MSTTEPTWPTEDEALAQWRRKRDYYTDDSPGMVRCAIDMCRAAWLAANDDPSKSPVGEVRGAANRVAIRVTTGNQCWPWSEIEDGRVSGLFDAHVKGWPVLGAVPGTPAAEAQQ